MTQSNNLLTGTLPFFLPPMHRRMAAVTESDQIFFRVLTRVASKLLVVNFEL